MEFSGRVLVGYDIGGTKIEIVFIDSKTQEIIAKKRHPTEREKGYEHILNVMAKLLQSQMQESSIKSDEIKSIGLALPGSVDPKTNLMTLGNTHVLENRNIQSDFQKLLSSKIFDREVPIFCANDANCFALAEYHLGVGKNLSTKESPVKNLVGIILGTGVGGGIIVNGKVLEGRRGSGGEIGHTSLKQQDKTCYCGQNDCVELFLSGPGFESYYFEKTREKKPLKDIFKESEFLQTYKKNLAKFLAQLTNILDPDIFVLGGGISLEKSLYLELEEFMVPHLFYKENPPLVVQHAISDSAGGIGAALFTHDA